LLKSRRRALHRAIARVLAERFRDTVETQPEVLAVHYTEAGESEPAVAAWQRAAEHAIARSAFVEAAGYYTKGLEVLGTLPDTPAREHLARAIASYHEEHHRALPSDPGVMALGYAAWAAWLLGFPDAARRHSREALALAQRLKKPLDLAFAQLSAVVLHTLLREPDRAREIAESLIQLATEQQFPLFLALGTLYRGWALAEQGYGEEGVAQLREAQTA